jgi:hypothetical protein
MKVVANHSKPLQLQWFQKDDSVAFALIRNNGVSHASKTLLLKAKRKAFICMENCRYSHSSIPGSDSPRSPQLRNINRSSGPRGSLRRRLKRALRTVAQSRRGGLSGSLPSPHRTPGPRDPIRPPKELRKEVPERSEMTPREPEKSPRNSAHGPRPRRSDTLFGSRSTPRSTPWRAPNTEREELCEPIL